MTAAVTCYLIMSQQIVTLKMQLFMQRKSHPAVMRFYDVTAVINSSCLLILLHLKASSSSWQPTTTDETEQLLETRMLYACTLNDMEIVSYHSNF